MRKATIKFFVLVSIIIPLAFPVLSSGQDLKTLKLATVNMQKALNESIAGKQSKAKLEMTVKNKTAEFQAREKKIIDSRSVLSNNLLNEDAKRKKIAELEKMQAQYLKERQAADRSLRETESKYTADIFKDIRKVIEKVAKEAKYDLVIEYSLYSALLYNNLDITDITQEIIDAYNDTHTKNN